MWQEKDDYESNSWYGATKSKTVKRLTPEEIQNKKEVESFLLHVHEQRLEEKRKEEIDKALDKRDKERFMLLTSVDWKNYL